MELDTATTITTTTTTTSYLNKLDDESFPNLLSTQSSQDAKKKKKHRGDRDEPTTFKKPIDHDPFAGMNTGVNYQQEIERLKALVQKADKKKVATAAAKPSSASSESSAAKMSHAPRSSSPTSPVLSTSSSTVSSSDSSVCSSSSSSDGNTHHECVEPNNDMGASPGPALSCSAITEEEKMRFLAFVRSWTGGWKGWHSNNVETGSLWQQAPWDLQRAANPPPSSTLQWQRKMDDLTTHSSPFLRSELYTPLEGAMEARPTPHIAPSAPASPAYFYPFDFHRPPRHAVGIIGDRHARRTPMSSSHPGFVAL